jgi:predicted anti-sigma-YlaC factor YlaD
VKRACEQISHLASEKLERKLTFRERLTMQMHFAMCQVCRYYSNNITKLHQVLQLKRHENDDDVRLSEVQRSAIKRAVQTLSNKGQ